MPFSRRARTFACAAVVAVLTLAGPLSVQPHGAQVAAPTLEVTAPAELAADRARVERYDPARLAGIVELVGLADPGGPIRVVLARESSDAARRAGPDIAGYALGRPGLVVIFPARSPVYPDDSIDDVLRHEVAHVLIDRAVAGHPVPRWYHEGLAMAAEHEMGLEDRTRLVYELALSRRVGLAGLDALFRGDRRSMTRAYTLAGAFVRGLLDLHGRGLPARLHRLVAAGVPFDEAFAEAAGETLPSAEDAFWRRQRLWTTWLPIATSTTVLWGAVTLLALWAIARRRRQRARLRALWDEEAAIDAELAALRRADTGDDEPGPTPWAG
ncbi:MAG: hypothetical protein AB7H88_05375 [Vicinamibacterales bacterium]